MTKTPLVLALFLAALPLAAEAGPREDSRAGMTRCDQISDDRAWLDCVYGAVQPMRARLGLSPAPDFQQRLATGSSSGALVRPPRPTGMASVARKGDDDWVRLSAYNFDKRGMFTVTLPDGTVWQQEANDVNYAHWKEPASHYTVSVGEGMGGHGTLELQNDGNEYLVRRIR